MISTSMSSNYHIILAIHVMYGQNNTILQAKEDLKNRTVNLYLYLQNCKVSPNISIVIQ